ncbi:E3 ubiquitin-protein ligase TRIM47-like [Brachyistius frenatus]|uniref:E3 ubiquitin-protein ligase TRIM47-like n=1 Tax=Brachyistius frenatus TaxID=100188 RepID=UPI0037E7C677
MKVKETLLQNRNLRVSAGKQAYFFFCSPKIHHRHTDMSAACSLLSEDQFLCSICLDVFTHPVTIPCGHNFCRSCISQHWSVNVQCQCPLCKEVCDRKPELRVNTFISEISAQFRRSAQRKTSCISERRFTGPDVPCDVCTETQLKAHKSCLVCLTSYCETHLEPHLRITGLKRHQLIDPRNNLEDRMCRKHDRPLEFFCRTDRTCVCRFCTESNHKQHRVVPLIEEYHQKKAELQKTGAEVQQLMEKKRLKVQQIRETVKLSRDDADRETTAGLQVFSALIRSAEEGLAQLVHTIQEKQKIREEQAAGFIVELQEEISELMKRSSEVEQLSLTEDHLHLLRSSPSLNAAPPTKDWTEVGVHCSYEGTVRRAVARLEEALGEEVKKLTEAELKRLRRFAVDVTLDPDTASPYLLLSEDGRQVKCSETQRNVPVNPRRFSICNGVLGKQSFSSGRFYYEVQVQLPGHQILLSFCGTQILAGPGVLLSLRSRPSRAAVAQF